MTSLTTSPTTPLRSPVATASSPRRDSHQGAALVQDTDDAPRTEHTGTFTASDNQVIFYRYWKPAEPTTQAVLLFHRGHEHSARWRELVDSCPRDDVWLFAWDGRGHGETEGPRGAAESFARMVADADEFAHHLESTHGIRLDTTAVIAQSVGAVLAATWVHDYAPPIAAMVLATPAFRIKLYVPGAIAGLWALQKVRPGSFIKSYVRPGMLTHDPAEAESYANDPLVSPQIAVNVLLDLHDTSTRLVEDAAAIHTPTLMFVSGKDYVVRRDVQETFFGRLSSSDKRLEVLPGFYHSTFWEAGRERVIEQSWEYIFARLSQPIMPPSSDTLARGSIDKYQACGRPTGMVSAAWYAMQRGALQTLGRLSRGVRIGWRDGFDSGQSLDHVYRNRAEGTTPIGKAIDRGYLDSIGWKGIRQRKVHMESMLDEAIDGALQKFGEVTILDIAAGPGRYVQETLARHQDPRVRAILCDRDPGGIAEGKRIAESLGVADRVTFCQSDAFDRQMIREAAGGWAAGGRGAVQIAIVSGLYELFPDNDPVVRSLSGVAEVLDDGGWLLYTNQPWHPQQEMIARVLPNRDGEPWVMRCRSQAEMNRLVAESGLSPEATRIDRWGIFTVSLARNHRRNR